MISLELPIYYTFTKKTKKDNKVLVGMNWYRNAHFRSSNQVKQHYHSLIHSKVTQSQKIKDKLPPETRKLNSNLGNGNGCRQKILKFVK